jgi:hypothetical protein
MKASDFRNLVIVGAMVFGGLGYLAYSQWRHHEFSTAYIEAKEAFSRAWEYKDAGDLFFEPRWKDFETAEDKLARIGAFRTGDQFRRSGLSNCGDELKLYRAAGDVMHTADDADLKEQSIDQQLRIQRDAISSCFKVE